MEIEDDFRCYIDTFKYLDVSEKKETKFKRIAEFINFF